MHSWHGIVTDKNFVEGGGLPVSALSQNVQLENSSSFMSSMQRPEQ